MLDKVKPAMRQAKETLAETRPLDADDDGLRPAGYGASGWASKRTKLYDADTPRHACELGIDGADVIDEIDTLEPSSAAAGGSVQLGGNIAGAGANRRQPSHRAYEDAFENEDRNGITNNQRRRMRRKTTKHEISEATRSIDSDSSDTDGDDGGNFTGKKKTERGSLWKSTRQTEPPIHVDMTSGQQPPPPPVPPPPRTYYHPRQRKVSAEQPFTLAWQADAGVTKVRRNVHPLAA